MLPGSPINPSEMTSCNHYCHGAAISFMHECSVGLQCVKPAWKKSRAASVVTGGMTHVEASYNTPHGKLGCSWSIHDEKKLTVTVQVPSTTTMKVVLPVDSETRTENVGAGEWTFSVRYRPDPEWPMKAISKVPWAE